jgi:hypothetical protein
MCGWWNVASEHRSNNDGHRDAEKTRCIKKASASGDGSSYKRGARGIEAPTRHEMWLKQKQTAKFRVACDARGAGAVT